MDHSYTAIKHQGMYTAIPTNQVPAEAKVFGQGSLTECATLAHNTAKADAQTFGLSVYVTQIGQNTWQIVESDWK